MLKKILIYLFISFSVFSIFSQNKLIVGKITFENLKRTDPRYLLKEISLKVGDDWNDAKREDIKSKLLKMTKLFEEAEVTERPLNNNTVEVIIKVLEKGAFLIIPYFSYSNSRGLMPKLAFRYFNLGGYSKYIRSKAEFIPTESINFNLRYEDPAVLQNENITYYIDSWFRTSIINYYANVAFINNNSSNTIIKGIPPLGALGNDGSQRWNRDLFYEAETTFAFAYKHPVFKYEFIPKINFLFKRVQERVDDNNNFETNEIVRQTIIRPKIEFFTSFPIKESGVSIQPLIYSSYEHYYGKDKFIKEFDARKIAKKDYAAKYLHDYREFFSEGIFKIGQKLSVPVLIKPISATLTPYIDFTYQKINSYAHSTYTDYIMMDYYDQDYNIRHNLRDSIDYYIGLTFDKSLNFKNTYHRFKVQGEYTQRVFGHWPVKSLVPDGKVDRFDFDADRVLMADEKFYNRKLDTKTSYYLYYPRFFFKFSYWFDVKFLLNHVLKFRSMLFARFNDRSEWDNYQLTDEADELSPGRVKGWAGWFFQLKYEIPLFDVKTPRWLTKSVTRPLRWGVFWDFFFDFGLAQNNEPDIKWDKYDKSEKIEYFRKHYDDYITFMGWQDPQFDNNVAGMGSVYKIKTSYTLDKDNLHLYPALAAGTSIRVLPKFVPIEIRLTVAASLWQIIRDKEITGKSVIIEFSIDDAF